jgi:hypothetical protein
MTPDITPESLEAEAVNRWSEQPSPSERYAFIKGYRAGIANRMEREGAEQKQAVDADWFKSLCRGFTHWGHDAIRLSDGTLILEPNGSEYDLCFAHRSDTWTLLKSPTRADVIRLLSALGINITQEAKQ